jgi:hypothetical protein
MDVDILCPQPEDPQFKTLGVIHERRTDTQSRPQQYAVNLHENKHRKGQRYLAERRFIHALIPDTDIVPRYTNSRE